jgi:threonine/homoserine/homoserine lactone efflux protein
MVLAPGTSARCALLRFHEPPPTHPLVTGADVELGLTALAAMLSPTTLTFSVFSLVLSERPSRTGFWFFFGAFAATLVIGVVAAFVLGNAAAAPKNSNEPPTWVAIIDVVLGVLLLLYVARALRRPRDPERTASAMRKMSKVSSSPVIAIAAAGATLANPGGFIPIALKDISQLNPNAGEYIALWFGFTVISLLPLLAAVIALAVSRDRAMAILQRARGWLERHARTLAAVIVVLLAAALLRNGIVALTS